MDELLLPDMLIILQDVEANPIYETQAVFKYIKTYIEKQVLKVKKLEGFLWKDKGKEVLLIKDREKKEWNLAEAEDLKDFKDKLAERKTTILANLNPLMGFMNNFKTDEYVVFKTKNVTNARDAGARCDQNSNKGKAIDILNTIVWGPNVEAPNYTYPPGKNISQKELCVIQEMYLRLFDKERKDKKRWFLSPPEAVLTNIEKYSTVIKKGKK
jgi:hypothetical protein